jgi:RNA polymerase sigma-70 factor (ECF subfamily)
VKEGDPSGLDRREAGWLERARQGDAGAYGHLVKMHQDRIFGLVLRMVRDAALAEELTQDTFLKAYRHLPEFRGESRFTTWLYRIAVNLCHDQRGSRGARDRGRETSLESPALEHLNPATREARPDEAAEVRELASVFEAGVEALDATYREAFLLRHQQGLNYMEIAEVLGISEGNAKVRVHRAREMILDRLRARGFEV